MIGLLTALVICGAVVYCVRTLSPLAHRTLQIAERRLVVLERGNESILDPDPMPEHLMAYVTDESEEWARADKAKRLRELYAEFKDWHKVEAQLMLEERGDQISAGLVS